MTFSVTVVVNMERRERRKGRGEKRRKERSRGMKKEGGPRWSRGWQMVLAV